MPKKKMAAPLADQLKAMKEEFKDDPSKPWQAGYKEEPAPTPKPTPPPKKDKPLRLGYPGPPVSREKDDVGEQVNELERVRKPFRAVGTAVDAFNTPVKPKAATETSDPAYEQALREEKAIDPNGAEARARKRTK